MKTIQHANYRDNIGLLTAAVDERVSMVPCPDFEGCKCFLQRIKMPGFLTNRVMPNLYYLREHADGSLEFISSSEGTEDIVRQ
mmetsp:Transcript_29031/g.34096  ORF Transcript_29031/g.34096 Transcript_29031/m.34096 type:complete len:83 (-) Transcript_29031:230-478(-)